jgi:hypothetical protein
MEGGRYLVRWYGYFLNTDGAKAHGYWIKLTKEDIVTVDMIWEECSDRLFNDPSGGSQSKDACLSFALFELFHLLKRRYFGMDCATRPVARKHVILYSRGSWRQRRMAKEHSGSSR